MTRSFACAPMGRVLVPLVAVLFASACGPDALRCAGADPADAEGSVAARLVQQVEAEPDSSDVAVVIDYDLLSKLASSPEPPTELREPLAAARAFAATIGISPDAAFELVRPPEIGEASGLFLATVRARADERVVDLRMVSDPDEQGRPTLWVLNDYAEAKAAGAEPRGSLD